MKKLLLLAAGVAALVFLAACTTTSTTASPAVNSPSNATATVTTISATVQKAVSVGCQVLQPIITTLVGPNGLTGGALKNAQTAQTDFNAVCGMTLTTTNLSTLVNTGLPALDNAIQASTLSASVKNDAAIALPLLQGALDAFATPTPVTPAAAASAPAAASSSS